MNSVTPASVPNVIGTGLVWLVLCLELVVSPTLGSASSVLALLLSLPLLVLLWRPGSLTALRQAPAQLIFAGVLLLLTALYVVTARQPTDVLFFANFLGMLLSAAVYLIALQRRGRDTAILLLRLCVVGTLVGLGSALFDVFGLGLARAQGLIGNPNLMPRIALPLGFVALAGFFVDSGWKRWLYLIAPVAAIVTTILCASRGAALAIPAMALIAVVFLWQDRQARLLVVAGSALLVVGLAAGIALEGPELFGRFGSIADTIGTVLQSGNAGSDGATQDRLDMYQAGIAAFRRSPWIGWGWANLGNAAAEINPQRFADAAGTAFLFHNDWVNFGVAAGIVGFICLAAFLVAPVVGALASPRDRYFSVRLYACLVLSTGYAIFGLTDSTIGYDAPTTLYAYLTALVIGALREA